MVKSVVIHLIPLIMSECAAHQIRMKIIVCFSFWGESYYSEVSGYSHYEVLMQYELIDFLIAIISVGSIRYE